MFILLPLVSRRKPIKEDPDDKNMVLEEETKEGTYKVGVKNWGEDGFEEEPRE